MRRGKDCAHRRTAHDRLSTGSRSQDEVMTKRTTLRSSSRLPAAAAGLRARRAWCAATLLGVVALAGCGSNDPAPSATASSPTTTAATAATTATDTTTATALASPGSAAPTGTLPASATRQATSPATSTRGGSAVKQPDVELPTDAGDYGGELISAWQAGDRVAVEALTSAAAAATITGKKAPTGLILTACEDDMCSWSSESGARLTLTYDQGKLADGAPHAVLAAKVG